MRLLPNPQISKVFYHAYVFRLRPTTTRILTSDFLYIIREFSLHLLEEEETDNENDDGHDKCDA